MKFNPLCIVEDLHRIDRACTESSLVQACWGWCPISVHINKFVPHHIRETTLLAHVCSSAFDSHETSFWLTEIHSQIQVTEWEVHTPPLQAWDLWQEPEADTLSGAGSDGGDDDE